MSIPRIAAIHDLSGLGKTSLTVAIPILSTLGIQVCPLPTAVLSSQTTGFDDFTFLDLTDQMAPILDHWERLGLKLDAVYSGFLAHPEQVHQVSRCIDFMRKSQAGKNTPPQNLTNLAEQNLAGQSFSAHGLAVIDPVLGDNGTLDPTMTPEMVEAMRGLIHKADIITPNFTEAAFLLGEKPRESLDAEGLKNWLRRLSALGPRVVVMTSAPCSHKGNVAVLAYERIPAANTCSASAPASLPNDLPKELPEENGKFWKVECPYIPCFYPGTGDIFASVLTGCLMNGDNLPMAVDRAVQFVTLAIRATFGHGSPEREGVFIERVLDTLRAPLSAGSYQVF